MHLHDFEVNERCNTSSDDGKICTNTRDFRGNLACNKASDRGREPPGLRRMTRERRPKNVSIDRLSMQQTQLLEYMQIESRPYDPDVRNAPVR